MNIKQQIKTKIQNLFGLNTLEINFKKAIQIEIIKSLKFDNSLQDEWLLSQFPTNNGGIKVTKNTHNLKKYLNLIRPIKWGGVTKNWW